MFIKVCRCSISFLVVATIATCLVEAQEPPKPAPLHAFRAKQILGSKVLIEGNTSVGTVDDIVLDSHGNVDYLIVLNSDNRLISVPWDATAFNLEKRVAT